MSLVVALATGCGGAASAPASTQAPAATAAPEPSPAVVSQPLPALEARQAIGPVETLPLHLLEQPGELQHGLRELALRPWRTRGVGSRTAALAVDVGSLLGPAPGTPISFTTFRGISEGVDGFRVDADPSDSTGAVGPQHYVEMVNESIAVYDKATGATLMRPVAARTLFSSLSGGCSLTDDGDVQVLYDQLADRWVASQFSVSSSSTTYWECVAVSKTGDPTGAWWAYAFPYNYFPDYPKLALWPDAYYATYARFSDGTASGTYWGPAVCAFDRAAMLQGFPATQQCVNFSARYGLALVASLDGATLPPAGSPAYVLSDSDSVSTPYDYLLFWRFQVSWQSPGSTALTGPTQIATGPYSPVCGGSGLACVTQPGTNQLLDTLGDRLMTRVAYRNFGDHESMVTNRTVGNGGTSAVRWWEIRSPGSTPFIFQEGTVAPDAAYRFMGSAAMDGQGGIGVGYSVSSKALSIYPSIAVSGRLATSPAGTMPLGETIVQAGGGSQTASERWGDYTSMTVDPTDDCTFYYVGQYMASTNAGLWSTRVARFSLGGCAAPDFTIGATPASLTLSPVGSGTSTIATTQVGGAGTVALSASVSPAGTGVTASLDRGSVAAGGSATLTVAATAGVVGGTYTVTVTGTEGANVHSTNVTVSVPSDFGIGASPTSLSLSPGGSGTSTIATTQVGGAGTVALSTSVSPAGAGVTASLDKGSVAAGGSATLTVSATAGATTGSYTVTVTGTEGAFTHGTSVAVTVSAPPAPAPSGGGGCSTTGDNRGSLLPLLALALILMSRGRAPHLRTSGRSRSTAPRPTFPPRP